MEPKLESTPRLRFTDDNNEPYPEWGEKKLGDIIKTISVVRSNRIPQEDILDNGKHPLISQGKANVIKFTNKDSWLFSSGTVIIYGDHTNTVKLASSPFVPWGDGIKLIRPIDPQTTSILYLRHSMSHYKPRSEGYKRHFSILKEKTIPLPSLPEQEKIGEFLSSLDTEVEQAERLVSLLSDRKKAYAQRIFDRTLRFHDDNNEPYPEWEEKRLGEVSEINPNGDIPESFEYIDLESVKNGSITLANTILKAEAPSRAKRLVNTNDILYSTVRPYQMNNVHIDESHNGSVASTGFAVLRISGVAVSDFLYSVVNSDMFYSKIEKACVGGTYPTINNYDLGQTLVPLPSLPEQEKIGSFLSALDDEIDQAKRELELLKEQKKAYAQRIFGV